jgi:hypothetical protein
MLTGINRPVKIGSELCHLQIGSQVCQSLGKATKSVVEAYADC